MIGDEKMEKEGTAEKVVSKVKEVAEDAKDAVEGAIEGVKNMLHKDENKTKKLIYLITIVVKKRGPQMSSFFLSILKQFPNFAKRNCQ